jgi:hypothetical protein
MSTDRIAIPQALGRILLTNDPDEMDRRATFARRLGALPGEVDHVVGLWYRQQATGDTSRATCTCTHTRTRHSRDGRTCFATLCGCARFTRQETPK